MIDTEADDRRAPGIFLSHTWRDKEFVRKLAQDLEKAGAKVWVDEAEIKLGDSLLAKIQDGIDEMDYLAVVLSPDSVESEWVKREVEIAMNQEIAGGTVKVLPLLYRNCDLPGFLIGKLYADFTEPDRYQRSLKMILERLQTDANSVTPLPSGDEADLVVAISSWIELDPLGLAQNILYLRREGRLRSGMRIHFETPELHALQQFICEQAAAGRNSEISIEQLAAVADSEDRLKRSEQVGSELLVDLCAQGGLKEMAFPFQYYVKQLMISIVYHLAKYQLSDGAAMYEEFASWFSGQPSPAKYAHLAYGMPRLVNVTVAAEMNATSKHTHVGTYLPLGRLDNTGGGGLIGRLWESAVHIPRDVWLDYVMPQAALWRAMEISTYRPLHRSEAYYVTEGIVSTDGVLDLEREAYESDAENGNHGDYVKVPRV